MLTLHHKSYQQKKKKTLMTPVAELHMKMNIFVSKLVCENICCKRDIRILQIYSILLYIKLLPKKQLQIVHPFCALSSETISSRVFFWYVKTKMNEDPMFFSPWGAVGCLRNHPNVIALIVQVSPSLL